MKYLLIVVYQKTVTRSNLVLPNQVKQIGYDAVVECIHKTDDTQIFAIESKSSTADIGIFQILENDLGEDLKSALWVKCDPYIPAYHIGEKLVGRSQEASK